MPFMGFILVQKIPEYIKLGYINTDVNNADSVVSIQEGPITIKLSPSDSVTLLQDSVTQTDSKVVDELSNGFNAGFNSGRSQSKKDNNTTNSKPGHFNTSFGIFFWGIFIAMILDLVVSYPFNRYFRRKRKGLEVSPRLEFFCRRFLLHMPLISTGLFSLVMIATVGYIGYINLFVDFSDSVNAEIFDDYFYISILAAFLSSLFVYYWHKHRVHLFYLEVLFNEEELRKRIFKKAIGKIKNRLWLASGMTALLPLTIVFFYLILSITKVNTLNVDLTSPLVRQIILGNYVELFNDNEIKEFSYMNSVNTFMMFFGIGTSIFVSLIYIISFVRWTTMDIIFPVKELLMNMQKTGEGKNANFSIVRTNDEIGELAEGFNIMSLRIKNYIGHINDINQSYYRFVPKQFLDFLDKKNILDIHLGDQIQKEMTVMFSDIRSFTEISEQMSPRENFNFINHYLGYMEPIISRNHGFIDKYIGDSIMALFPDSPDDAINAAIEMRAKLQEFNDDLKLSNMQPINSGIGINTGNLMLGIVGGKGRIEGTVISDHVNLASRLEGLTKKYGTSVIISQDTLIKLKNPQNYHFRFLDMVTVKGKRNSVNIFEILDGEVVNIRNAKIQTNEAFKKALQYYRNRDMIQALSIFKEVEVNSPSDMAVKLYIKRCEAFIQNGIPDDWDGISSYFEK
jgi:class 3 adenylate cyclase